MTKGSLSFCMSWIDGDSAKAGVVGGQVLLACDSGAPISAGVQLASTWLGTWPGGWLLAGLAVAATLGRRKEKTGPQEREKIGWQQHRWGSPKMAADGNPVAASGPCILP